VVFFYMEETNKRLHDTMDHVVQYTVSKSCVLINTSYENELNDILRLTHYLGLFSKSHLYNFFILSSRDESKDSSL
jgi:hypothetical protein